MNNEQTPQLTIPRVTSSVFCSDNLELMKTIESNTIDLIYCDILYGTGRKFSDYQDLKPIRSEIEAHYIPRIKEMHRILKPTGSIYLQMDTKINHWIRCLLDSIFGYDNFRNEIIWSYKTGGVSKNFFARKHDTIFFYSKSPKYNFNTQYYRSYQAKKYNFSEKYPEIWDEKKKMWYHNSICRDIWDDIYVIGTEPEQKERVGYYSQKPKELIERIIKASSNEGDLVADFYMGSGTTAEVCKDLKRNFIGCDINPRAVEITLKRLKDARS